VRSPRLTHVDEPKAALMADGRRHWCDVRHHHAVSFRNRLRQTLPTARSQCDPDLIRSSLSDAFPHLPQRSGGPDDREPDPDTAFRSFYLESTRQPAIYLNLFFGLLLLAIVPIRSLCFGLPVFPTLSAALLEWGVMVPACFGTLYLRASTWPTAVVMRGTSTLIALNFTALFFDLLIWQQNGVPMPYEYTALYFVGLLSVDGLPARYTLALCGLFLGLNVTAVQMIHGWTPAAGFELYFDIVAVCIALLNSLMLRNEAMVAWTLKTRLNTMAFRDALTGLGNWYHLDDRVGPLFQRAHRERRPVSVALVDVDRFKGLNDSHGHPAGDAALQQLGRALQHVAVGPIDIAARIGGDEFILVWFDIDRARCEQLCRELQLAIADAGIRNTASDTGVLTTSIGAVTGVPAQRDDFEHFRRCADAELYKVKNNRKVESLRSASI